jgi:hypothetical protein
MANYKTFSPILTTQTKLDDGEIAIKEGQLIVTRDGGGIYYDTASDRVLVSKDDTKLDATSGVAYSSLRVKPNIISSPSGSFYPLFAASTATHIIPTEIRNSCSFYEGSNTSNFILGNSTATTATAGRKGQLEIYGTGTGSTKITPGNTSSDTNTLTLPATTGTLATQETMAATYLPLTGGTLSGDLYAGDTSKTTESKVCARSTAGGMQMYSNPASGNRGLWDEKGSNYIVMVDSSNNVQYVGGTVNNNLAIKSNLTVGDLLTASGRAYIGATQTVKSMTGTSGTWGYVNFMRIQVNGTYNNKPISFNVHQRGRPMRRIELRFKNTQNATDHVLEQFDEMNLWDSSGIYATQSSGVVNLYANKSEAYDTVSVSDLTYDFSYMGLTITYPGTLTTSAVSGWSEAACWKKNNIPTIYYGTSTPSSSTGKNGDIYVVYS